MDGSPDAGLGGGVGDSLYEKAKIMQARKVMLSKLLPEQCTFVPQVNAREVKGRVGEVHERLHAQGGELQLRKELLASSTEAECTFSPSITKRAQRLTEESERQRQEKGLNVGESLYSKGVERQKERAETLSRLAKEGLTFKPSINARSAEKQSSQHFSDRLYNKEIVAKRREKEFNTPDSHLQAELTFKPAVNPRRSTPGNANEAPATPSSPFERLYQAALRQADNHRVKAEAAAAATLQGCTFHPETSTMPSATSAAAAALTGIALAASGAGGGSGSSSSSSSAGDAASTAATSSPGTAFSRLYGDAKERRERLAAACEVAAAAPMPAECTFEPALSQTTRKITARLRAAAATHSPLTSSSANGSPSGEGALGQFLEDEAAAAAAAAAGGAGEGAGEGAAPAHHPVPRYLQLYEEGMRQQRERREQAALVEQVGGLIRLEDALECTFQPRVSAARFSGGGSGSGRSGGSGEAFTYSRNSPLNVFGAAAGGEGAALEQQLLQGEGEGVAASGRDNLTRGNTGMVVDEEGGGQQSSQP